MINKQKAKTQLYTINPRETVGQASAKEQSPTLPRLERRLSIARNVGPGPALRQLRISPEEFQNSLQWDQLIPEISLFFVSQLIDADAKAGVRERKDLNWKNDPRSKEALHEDLY